MADGSVSTTRTVQQVLQYAMNQSLPFNQVRMMVAKWAEEQGCRILSTDRTNGSVQVLYEVWESGERIVVTVLEPASYTTYQPISTW